MISSESHPQVRALGRPGGVLAEQARWFISGAALAFAVPYLFSSILELGHDAFLVVYMASVVTWLSVYARATELDVRGLFQRHWRASVLLGVVLTALLVRNVLAESATDRPDGAYFVFELVWRGGLYGAVDALLLTAFPCAVVYTAMGGDLSTWGRRAAYFGVSLVLVVTITAIYHLGYSQYREDGVGEPETGNTIISVPALLTANPAGAVIAHTGMHVASVAHIYETDVRLPPATTAD